MSGGGDSTPPTQQVNSTTTTNNLPEYARPYYENVLNRAQAESYREYTPFQGQRIAGFTPDQQALQAEVRNMQTPGQFGAASDLAYGAGLAAANAGQYTPTAVFNQQVQMPGLRNFGMGAPQGVGSQQFSGYTIDAAQTGFRPNLQNLQMSGARDVGAQNVDGYTIGAARTNFAPNLQNLQMDAAQQVAVPGAGDFSAFEMEGSNRAEYDPNLQDFTMQGAERFGSPQAQQYMSPYIQNVLDIQKREAITDARKAQLAQDLGAVRQGSYGGARQLLAATERERALGQNLGDIQARGLQAAYENAQAQFERDRSAGMSVEQANQQARLGVQQLGAQTGLQAALANQSTEQQRQTQNQAAQLQAQGMSAEQAMRAALANQQAGLTVNQQNLQAQLQTQQLGTQTGLQAALANLSSEQQANVQNQAAINQARGMNAENAMRAALANQQAGLTVGQQNLQAGLQTQQLGTQTGLQAALANLSSQQQANVQNQAAINQAQGMNAENALRAALANQQAGLTVGQQNLQAQLQTQQLGTQTGLQAALANQSSNLDAQRMAEQSRQFSSQQGLAGLGQMLEAGRTLGNLGLTQQQADQQRLQMQGTAADRYQQQRQQQLDMAYADFLRQRDYPMEQLGYFSNLLRGVPVGLNTTGTTYAPPPSMLAQVGGVGLGALGLSNMARG